MTPFKEYKPCFGTKEIEALREYTKKQFLGYFSDEQFDATMEKEKKARLFKNDKYTVAMYDAEVSPGNPEMIWLSIRRNDLEAITDWREMQQIKNELVGPENEAVELFPAESRLVDTSNQYHLWVIKDNTIRFPFGMEGRAVIYDKPEELGGKQRGK